MDYAFSFLSGGVGNAALKDAGWCNEKFDNRVYSDWISPSREESVVPLFEVRDYE